MPVADLTRAHLAHFLVVERCGTLAGCIGIEPFGADALLRSLAVSEAARGHGIGTQLVGEAEAAARASGARTMWLLTTGAAEFFAARGYRRVDRAAAPPAVLASTQFAGLCPVSAVCLARQIDH